MKNKQIVIPTIGILCSLFGIIMSLISKNHEYITFIVLLLCNICLLTGNIKKK